MAERRSCYKVFNNCRTILQVFVTPSNQHFKIINYLSASHSTYTRPVLFKPKYPWLSTDKGSLAKMSESTIEQAKREIDDSLVLSAFCMRRIGLSFQDPMTGSAYLRQKLMLILSVCSICYHVFSEIVFIGLTLSNSPRVEDVVPLFHTFGYGALSK